MAAVAEFFSRNLLFMFTALNFLGGWWVVVEEDWVLLEPSWTRVGRVGAVAGRVSAVEEGADAGSAESLAATADEGGGEVSESLLTSSLAADWPGCPWASATDGCASSSLFDSDSRMGFWSVFAINASQDANWSSILEIPRDELETSMSSA